MIVFRLAKTKFSRDLSGKGAEKAGGRWNSRGIAMAYTSESRALCTAEIAVHVPLGILPGDFQLVSILIPDTIHVYELAKCSLSSDWRSIPHSGSTQELGDTYIRKNKFAVMKVPSAVVPGDSNYLINPDHPDVKKIQIVKVEPFIFDKRMFFR